MTDKIDDITHPTLSIRELALLFVQYLYGREAQENVINSISAFETSMSTGEIKFTSDIITPYKWHTGRLPSIIDGQIDI